MNIPNNAVAFLEALLTRPYFIDLAGNITSEDGRPLLNKDAGILHVPVERVDGNGGVLHDDSARAGGGKGGVTDFEGSVGFGEPCGLVL